MTLKEGDFVLYKQPDVGTIPTRIFSLRGGKAKIRIVLTANGFFAFRWVSLDKLQKQ